MPSIRHSVLPKITAANAASHRWKADIERALSSMHHRTTLLERRDGPTRSRLSDVERRVGAVRRRMSDTKRREAVTHRRLTETERHIGAVRRQMSDNERREAATHRRLAEVERRVTATERVTREMQGRKTEAARDSNTTGRVWFRQSVARCFPTKSLYEKI